MKNKWSVQNDAFAVWHINLQKKWDDPEVPLQWLLQVVTWAEELGIMKVIESPSLHFHRDSGQTIQDRLVQEYREAGILDLGRFTEQEMWIGTARRFPRLESELAWYNQMGGVVEGPVQLLGTHLADCRPDLDLHDYRSWTLPPFFLRGNPVSTTSLSSKTDRNWHINNIYLDLHTNTDIWQPYVFGKHDDWRSEVMHDNTPLANIHTPRLNEFLNRVRNLTLQVDGRWDGLDLDQSKGIHTMYRTGTIDLDWTPEVYWPRGDQLTDEELCAAGDDIE